MLIDISKTNYATIPFELFQRCDLTGLQKLFLMQVMKYQADGLNEVFLSQSEFARFNKFSREAVRLDLKNLVERDIIKNLGQKGTNLACGFYVNPEFMKGLGYYFIERKAKEPLPELETKPEPAEAIEPNLSAEQLRELMELEKKAYEKQGVSPF